MYWIYELLDNHKSIEKHALVTVNVLLGVIFGFTYTFGFLDHAWMVMPQLASSFTYVVGTNIQSFLEKD